MVATRERLIDNLYSGLDPSPDEEIVLRIGQGGKLSWTVSNDVLTVMGANGALSAFKLSNTTIGELANSLSDSSIDVKYINNDFLTISAAAIIDGSGTESETNGDALSAFTSILWAFMDAYAVELDAANSNIDEAIADLYINSATGEILDIWGKYFGDPRNLGESDSDYSKRIIIDTLRPKSNKYALINAADALSGSKIDIYEPWTDLFFLSQSNLDDQHTYDGDMWSPYVFRPQLRAQQNIKWAAITALFEKLRPAAVFQLPPEFIPDTRGNEVSVKGLGISQTDDVFVGARYADKMNLDDYHLGDPVINNYRMSVYDIYGMGLYKLMPIGWNSAQDQQDYYWNGSWDSRAWDILALENGWNGLWDGHEWFGALPANGWDNRSWNDLYPSIGTPIPELPLELHARRLFVHADIVLSDMDEGFGHERFMFTGGCQVTRNVPVLDDFLLSDFDMGTTYEEFEDVYLESHILGNDGTQMPYSLGINVSNEIALSATVIGSLDWNGAWSSASWDAVIADIGITHEIGLSVTANAMAIHEPLYWNNLWSSDTWSTTTLSHDLFWNGSWSTSSWNSNAFSYGFNIGSYDTYSLQGAFNSGSGINSISSFASGVSVSMSPEYINAMSIDCDYIEDDYVPPDYTVGYFQSMSLVPSVVAETVVTTEYIEVNPTNGAVSLMWADNWSVYSWDYSSTYSGICITVQTENN